MRINIIKFLIIFFICMNYSICYGLEVGTHKQINETIVRYGYGINLDNYLKNNLNFPEGYDASFNAKKIFEWVGEGGVQEDLAGVDYFRSMNHFHDPLVTDWWDAGFKGKQSSIIWAQSTNQVFGDYSWRNGRSYFYNALTANNESQRTNNFADTFRALGQVMHLIEDASVPAHVRNDSHMWGYHYEKYVENRRVSYPDQFFFDFMLNYYSFNESILNETPNPQAPIPIAKIVDTDKYTGNNPEITAGFNIGLSEYVNANFFSEGSAMDYPNPALSNLQEEVMLVQDTNYPNDPTMKTFMHYYRKVGGGETVDHLAAISYMSHIYTKYELQPYYDKIIFLDDNCYNDYAYKLIPRAVGYAAGLMKYFFRGQIDAVDANATTDTGGNITGMTLKVKNNTPGETMYLYNGTNPTGYLVVSYSYTKSDGIKVYGCSNQVQLTSNISSGNDTSTDTYKYSFTFSPSIPSGATVHYMLVYRGKLGLEDDAVAGKVFSIKAGWGYLLIKQDEYTIGSEGEYTYTQPVTPAWGGWSTDSISSDLDINNNIRNFNFSFHVDWVGDKEKITNVAIWASFWYKLYDLNSATSTRMLTFSEPTGVITAQFSLPADWNFNAQPIYIVVDTESRKRFFEPAIFSMNNRYVYAGCYGDTSTKSAAVESSLIIPAARYSSDYNSSAYGFEIAKYTVEDSSFIFNKYSYPNNNRYDYFAFNRTDLNEGSISLPPFLPYSTKIVKVKRTFENVNSMSYLSNIPAWEVPVDCWVSP